MFLLPYLIKTERVAIYLFIFCLKTGRDIHGNEDTFYSHTCTRRRQRVASYTGHNSLQNSSAKSGAN